MSTPRASDRFRPPSGYRCGDLVPQRWVFAVGRGDHVHSRMPGGGQRCHRVDDQWCFAGFGPLRSVGSEDAAVLAPLRTPGLPGPGPAEAAAALASLQNVQWSAVQPVVLPVIPEDPAPMPDAMREEYTRLFADATMAEPPSYNFVVIRRDADDLAATLNDYGQALVDDPDTGVLRVFPTVADLVEAYGGERRVKLVWERDQWPPAAEFNADMVRQAVAAGRARHLATPPAERPIGATFSCPGDLPTA